MAGNYRKYRDRMPLICAAGKVFDDPLTMDNVPKILKEYSVEDAIDTLKSNAHIRKEEFKEPLSKPPIDNKNFYRSNPEIRGILQPGVSTRYQTLLADFEETVHESYWNKELGKQNDPTPGLPKGMIPVLERFGKKNDLSVKAGVIINPQKSPYEVLRDSQVGHEMYVKTHQDYNPGERTERNYRSPPYDSTKRFGRRYNYDYRGIWVKCACEWHIQKSYIHCNKRITDFVKHTKPQLAKPFAPNHNLDRVPKDHSFGRPTERPMFSVGELLKGVNYEPCMFQRDMHNWLAMWNKLKMVLRKKISKGYLILNDFLKTMVYYDKEKSGFMAKDLFYDLCERNNILFSMGDMEPFLKLINIIKDDGTVDYAKFINLVNPNGTKPLEIMPIKDLPESSLYYITGTDEMACDDLFVDNSKLRTAGNPSFRTDLARPYKTEGIHESDKDSLPNFTTVKTLLNPSIYTRWGLSFRDFFLPRKPEIIRKLFERIGYNLSDSTFQKLWTEGVAADGTGLCCVDTFKKLIQKHFPPPSQFHVDESDCRDIFPKI